MFKLKMFLMRNRITGAHLFGGGIVFVCALSWWLAGHAVPALTAHMTPRVIELEGGQKCVMQYSKVVSCDWGKNDH